MATQETQDTATSEIDPQAAWDAALEHFDVEHGAIWDAATYLAYAELVEDRRPSWGKHLFL